MRGGWNSHGSVEEQLEAGQVYYDLIVPLTMGGWDMARAFRIGDEFWAGDRVVGRPAPSYGDIQFPNSQAIRNALLQGRFLQSISLGEMQILRNEFEELRSLIELH